jgi:hypothetical protein
MKVSKIKSLLKRKEFFSIVCIKSELGYRTRQKGKLTCLEDIIEYVEVPKQSVRILFEPEIEHCQVKTESIEISEIYK